MSVSEAMAPVVTIVDTLFEQATFELHEALSDLSERSKGPLTVRRRVPERRDVLVDINDNQLRPINRFRIEYAKETAGNRAEDGVNAVERRRPTTVTAYAGTMHQSRYVATFEDRDPLEVYEWMLRTVVQNGGLSI